MTLAVTLLAFLALMFLSKYYLEPRVWTDRWPAENDHYNVAGLSLPKVLPMSTHATYYL